MEWHRFAWFPSKSWSKRSIAGDGVVAMLSLMSRRCFLRLKSQSEAELRRTAFEELIQVVSLLKINAQ